MIKILKFEEVTPEEVFARTENTVNVEDIVAGIIADVKANGDKALFAYCEKFDRAKLETLQVTKEEIDEAVSKVAPEFLDTLPGGLFHVAAAVFYCLSRSLDFKNGAVAQACGF